MSDSEELVVVDSEEDLENVCKCVVCLQTLALPVTWSCGHSFCKSCTAGLVLDTTSARGSIRCPTCRKVANMVSVRRFAVSNVLRFLIARIYPKEIEAREAQVIKDFNRFYAQLQGPTAEGGFAGENNGEHTLGWQVVVPSETFILKRPVVQAKRNIVRDAEDYAMQLTLAPISSVNFIPNFEEFDTDWNIRFAVLEMEEDEVADGGFPFSIHEHDDAEFMDMALIRQSFSGELTCEIRIDGKTVTEINANLNQGVAEFELSPEFDELTFARKSLTPKSEVEVIISHYDSKMTYSFKFQVYAERDKNRNPHQKGHLVRKSHKKKNDQGEELASEIEETSDEEEEEDSSLDGFIVDDETEPSPAPKSKSNGLKKSSSASTPIKLSSDDEEDDVDIIEIDDDNTPASKKHRKNNKKSKKKKDRKESKQNKSMKRSSNDFVDSFNNGSNSDFEEDAFVNDSDEYEDRQRKLGISIMNSDDDDGGEVEEATPPPSKEKKKHTKKKKRVYTTSTPDSPAEDNTPPVSRKKSKHVPIEISDEEEL